MDSRLINGLKEFNIELSDKQTKQFHQYYDLLVEWNSFMNLTAITEWEEVVTKHFIDSLSLIKVVEDLKDKPYKIIDIGTGAGFPGIPLKIAFPNLKITLMDSLNKRVKFLNEVIDKLGLEDIEAVHARAEEMGQNSKYRETYDIAVSRAVANMTVLSELCIPFVTVEGKFISYKSSKIDEEYTVAKNAIGILGGEYLEQIEFDLPDSDIYRNMFVIKKIKVTPKKYPRKPGTPAKEPLS